MLLGSVAGEPGECDACQDDSGGNGVVEDYDGPLDAQDVAEQSDDIDETDQSDCSSSEGGSDADNCLDRKTGAARVMVESFADRCVVFFKSMSTRRDHVL
jgi:hypothetical protein